MPKSAMEVQIESLPELFSEQTKQLRSSVIESLTTPEIFSIQHIIITGCGDSLFAGMAVKNAFETWTGRRTLVLDAMEAARYYPEKRIGTAPNDPLLIAISVSGKVSRVCEAVERFNAKGALTLGITKDATSPLGKTTKKIIPVQLAPMPSAPGVRSFASVILALYLIAMRIAEVTGKLTQTDIKKYRQKLTSTTDIVSHILTESTQRIKEIAVELQNAPCVEFIAAGPLESAARYGAAKMYEACGRHGIYVDTESWFHLNFFHRDRSTPMICFSGANSLSTTRMKELVYAATQLGRPLLLICEEINQNDFILEDKQKLVLPTIDDEMLSPLFHWIPTAIIAAEISDLIGESYGRGDDQPWRDLKNQKLTMNSRMIEV